MFLQCWEAQDTGLQFSILDTKNWKLPADRHSTAVSVLAVFLKFPLPTLACKFTVILTCALHTFPVSQFFTAWFPFVLSVSLFVLFSLCCSCLSVLSICPCLTEWSFPSSLPEVLGFSLIVNQPRDWNEYNCDWNVRNLGDVDFRFTVTWLLWSLLFFA